jgi:hypothetical protein
MKRKMSHGEGRGSEKCRKSVTYYLNVPLYTLSVFYSLFQKFLALLLLAFTFQIDWKEEEDFIVKPD